MAIIEGGKSLLAPLVDIGLNFIGELVGIGVTPAYKL